MRPAIDLRRKIRGTGTTLGILISNHLWLDLIEIAVQSGLDYVIIDAEHFGHSQDRIAEACQLGRLTNFPVLLRPARTDAESIRSAMDLGPCGLLLPMIESARQLEEVQAGAYLPPRGERRPGGPGNRWVKQYDYETFKSEIEDHLIIIPQIEGPLGLKNAKEIAAHPIVTALGVGPFDLSAGLGLCWKPQDPVFRAALSTIRDAAQFAGKPTWMIGDGEGLKKEGYRFLCIGEPIAMLQGALTSAVQKLRVNGHGLNMNPESIGAALGSASYTGPTVTVASLAQGRNGSA